MKLKMWRAGGGSVGYVYGFGYWTGEQGDLLCVKICKTNKEAERNLSPMRKNIVIAFLKFMFKFFERRRNNF